MKKLLKKLSVMRLEERVLFDAAAAVAAAEADTQAQQNEELQQQQQQLQEQLAAEAAQQQAAEAEAQAAAAAEEDAADSDAAAQGADEPAPQQENAGSDVSAAVEAIAADEGVILPLETIAEESVIAPESTILTADEIAAAIAEGTRHELVIVSDNVKDAKVIIDGLAEGTEVLTLDRNSDVLDQINEYLDKSDVKYDAIHLVTHGGDGFLLINNNIIDMESLEADPASWAAIGEHITEDGDMLLYGCNVAQTEEGKAFANQLASLTGADIAASIDSVGGSYGWELEYVTAAVSTPVLTVNGYDTRMESYILVGTNDWGTKFVNTDGEYQMTADGQLQSYDVVSTTKDGDKTIYTYDWVTKAVTFDWFVNNAVAGDTFVVAQGVEAYIFTDGAMTDDVNDITAGTEVAGYMTVYAGTDAVTVTLQGDSNYMVYSNGTVDITVSGNKPVTGVISVEASDVNITLNNLSNGNLTIDGGTLSLSAHTGETVINSDIKGVTLGEGSTLSFKDHDGVTEIDGKLGTLTLAGAGTAFQASGLEINGLSLSGSGEYSLTDLNLAVGSTITVKAGQTLNIEDSHISIGTLTLNNGTLNIGANSTVTVTNYNISIQGSSLSDAFVNGKTYGELTTSEKLTLASNLGNINGGQINLTGNGTIGGEGQLTLLGGVSFGTADSGATLTVDGASVAMFKLGIEGTSPVLKEATITGDNRDVIALQNDGKLSLQAGTGTFTPKITLNDGTLAFNNELGKSATIADLELMGEGGKIAGLATIDQLTFANSATTVKFIVAGEGTDIRIGSIDGSGIEDYASSAYAVAAGASLTVTLENSTIYGMFGVGEDSKLHIHGDRAVFGTQAIVGVQGGDLVLTGNITFRNSVFLTEAGGSLTVKGFGDGINFLSEVTSASGWYGNYVFTDNLAYYTGDGYGNLSQAGTALVDGAYEGRIELSGKVYFGDSFISTGTTVIKDGFSVKDGAVVANGIEDSKFVPTEIVFSEKVAVAAGTFTVEASDSTKVTFMDETYISAVYNGYRATQFNIKGGTVVFQDNVYNWVRSWRGDLTLTAEKTNDYIVTKDKRYWSPELPSIDGIWETGDLVYAVKETIPGDTTIYKYSWVIDTDRMNSSAMNISSGNVEFKGNYFNNGSFGDTKTLISGDAKVEFKSDVYNISYLTTGLSTAESSWSYAADSRHKSTWDSELVSILGSGWSSPFADGELTQNNKGAGEAGGKAVTPEYGYSAGARFGVTGNATVSIDGDIRNAGIGTTNTKAPNTYVNTGLYIAGNYGLYKGDLTNTGYLDISGNSNQFLGTMTNSGNAEFSGSNSFGFVINKASGDMNLSRIGTSTITLENHGNLQFVGLADADNQQSGLRFVDMGSHAGLDVQGGKVVISSYVGDAGFIGSVNVTANAEVYFTVGNTIDNITNAGSVYISQGTDAARTFVIEGAVENTGTFAVSGKTDFQGEVTNEGRFDSMFAGISYNNGFINDGTLYVAKTAAFASLINRGTVSLAAKSGKDMGATQSVFRNLENYSTFNASGDNLVFADSLLNRGTFNLTGNGVIFKNMVDADGTISFINEGTITISNHNDDNSYIDIDNRADIIVTGYINVSFGKVINTGSITMTQGTETLNFNGTIDNSGTITGSGDVNFNYITTGDSELELTGSSTVTYDYDSEAYTQDESGFYRVGGELVYYINEQGKLTVLDAYTNRPVFDTVKNAWMIGDTVVSNLSSTYDPYVEDGKWFIGSYNTGVAAAETAKVLTTDAKGNWMWGENKLYRADGTAINNAVSRNFYGGNVVNITVRGDATLSDSETRGISLISGLTLNVNGTFTNDDAEGVRVVINNGAVLNLNNSYADVANASLQIDNGARVNFNIAGQSAEIKGEVANNGAVTLASNKTLIFAGETTGDGTVDAASGTTYAYNGGGHIYNAVNGYDRVSIGADVNLENVANINILEFSSNAKLTVTGEEAVLNVADEVKGGANADFLFTEGASGNFSSSKAYTIGDVMVNESSDGVNFNGTQGNVITVTELDNDGNVAAKGYNAFTEVENNGIFTASGTNTYGTLINSGNFTANGTNTYGSVTNEEAFTTGGTNSFNAVTNSGNFSAAGTNSFNAVTNSSSFTVSGENDFTGAVTNNVGGTFNVNGTSNDFTGAVTNAGTFNVNGASSFNTIANNAVFNVNSDDADLGTITLGAAAQLNVNADLTFDNAASTLVANESGAVVNVSAGKSLTIAGHTGMLDAKFNVAATAAMTVEVSSGVLNIWAVDVARGASLTIDGYTAAAEDNVATWADVIIGVDSTDARYTGSGLFLEGDLRVESGILRVYNYVTENDGVLATSATINVSANAGLHLFDDVEDDGEAAPYGKIYTATGIIQSHNGIIYGGDRISLVATEDWIIISENTTFSAGSYDPNANFRVVDGVVFTIDDDNVVIGTLRVEGSSSVVITGSVNVTQEITVENDNNEAKAAVTVSGDLTVSGNVNLNDDLALSGNGNVTFGATSTLVAGEGAEVKGSAGTVTYNFNDAAILDGAYNNIVINGTGLTVGDITIAGAVTGAGTIAFNGSTAGAGKVSGTELTATYSSAAGTVYGTAAGSSYKNVTMTGVHTLNGDLTAENANFDNTNGNGSVTIKGDATLTVNGALLIDSVAMLGNVDVMINGDTNGNGTFGTAQKAYEGTVTYNGTNQTIYAGNYNGLNLGANAAGQFDTAGDITVSGNAVNQSASAELNVTDSKVTYNGNGSQQVMAGSYDEIVLSGSGTKLMEAGTFEANSFTANGSASNGMLKLVSASAPAMWTLDAKNVSINNVYVDNANANSEIMLNGTNMTGNGNSSNWAVFSAGSGIGDSYPAINNPNFQAIVPHLIALDQNWNGTGRFDAFRRLPVSTEPIAVGDMSAPMVLDAFESYDMVNFDGEFFGNSDAIGLMDEESGDVLNDAASSGNGDLKALIEK